MTDSELQAIGKEIKTTLERERCAACNNRKAQVQVKMSARGPQLQIMACCFSFEKKLRDMADVIWKRHSSTAKE